MDFSFAVFVTGGVLRFVDKCVFGDVESCGSQTASVHVDLRTGKYILCLVSKRFGMQTFSSVFRDKTGVARQMIRTRLC